MSPDEEMVFNALDDYIQLQKQGEAPSPEKYVLSYPEGVRAELLKALHNIPSDADQQQAWNSTKNKLYPENN